MYGLIGKMTAAPGRRDELAAILLEGLQAMPGLRSYIVANDPADPDALWVTEVWQDKESHANSLLHGQLEVVVYTLEPGARSGEMLLKGQAAIVSKQWPTPRSHEVGGYQYDHGNPKKPYLTLTGMACSRPAQINGTYGTSSRTVLLNYYLRIRATTSSELRSEMRALLRLAIRRRGRGWTRSAPAAYVRPSFRRSLNPRFVAWLMGWPPPASTGFGFSATAWSRWRQAMRSALLSLGLPPEDQPRQADLFA